MASPTDDDELDLKRAFQQGVPGAFEELVRRYREAMQRYANNRLQNTHDAEEVVQEAWLNIDRARARFKPETSFAAWAFRILHNVIIDHFRRRKARPKTRGIDDLEQIAAGGADPMFELDLRALVAGQENCMNKLDNISRRVLLLRCLEEKSARDIAEELNLTAAAVYMRLFKAHQKMMDCLKRKGLIGGDQ